MARTLLIVAVLLVSATIGDAATVSTSLTPTRARIGDLLHLKVSVEGMKSGSQIEWPIFEPDSLAFQLISVDSTGKLPQERTFNLALYDTGKYLLPPLPIVLHVANSNETLFTRHFPVEIVSSLPDSATVPRPIKGPRSLPLTLRDVLAQAVWPAIILLLAVAGFLVYRRYRKKVAIPEQKIPEIILPAHELAMRELIELRDKKFPQRGMLKEFFTELSEILRRYMERRYKFPALEMATWDIEQELSGDSYPQILRNECLLILHESDLVKFAKFIPPWESCDKHLERSFEIVSATKETDNAETIGEAA
jgi:hypothetical protein